MADQMYIATQSGTCEVDAQGLVFVKDRTLVSEGHPLLTQCPDYFKPVEEHTHYEEATILPIHTATETTTVAFDATEGAVALAADHDIDLATVAGSGTEGHAGRITKEDVQKVVDGQGS